MAYPIRSIQTLSSSQSVLIVTLSIALLTSVYAIVISRSDKNFDIILTLNGQQLRAQNSISLPAYQQTVGVVLPNGQRVPPSIMIQGGALIQLPAQNGVANMVIHAARSYSSGGGGGSEGGGGSSGHSSHGGSSGGGGNGSSSHTSKPPYNTVIPWNPWYPYNPYNPWIIYNRPYNFTT